MDILTYSALIHDFGIATFQHWKELSYHNWQQLEANAKVAGRSDIASIILNISVKVQLNRSPEEYLKFYLPTAEFMSGKHTDDYFATIPNDIVNIIFDMLQTTTETLLLTHRKDKIQLYNRCTYFYGVPHSFDDAPAKIEWSLHKLFKYSWYNYGHKPLLYSIRGTSDSIIVCTIFHQTKTPNKKHGRCMHYYGRNEFESTSEFSHHIEYCKTTKLVSELLSRAMHIYIEEPHKKI